jgi:hypothetical protein
LGTQHVVFAYTQLIHMDELSAYRTDDPWLNCCLHGNALIKCPQSVRQREFAWENALPVLISGFSEILKTVLERIRTRPARRGA